MRDLKKIREWMINRVKTYIRDRPELNNLIDGDESTPDLINLCMEKVIDDYNATPPPMGTYTLTNFPSSSLLIDGTVCEVLRSVAISFSRNSLSYTDGGINVSDQEKAREYLAIADIYCQRYQSTKTSVKVAKNIESLLSFGGTYDSGGIESEYSELHGYSNDEV